VRTCINPECFKEFPVDHDICDYCGWPQDVEPSSEAGVRFKVQRAIRNLSNPDPEIQKAACWALEAIGPAASEAVPALVDLIKRSENDWVVWRACRALRRIGPAASEAVPALAYLIMRSGNGDVLWAACRTLEEIGPAASEAVPALVDLIKRSRDKDVLYIACQALRAIGPSAVPALADLIKRGSTTEVLKAACDVLKEIGPAASEAVPALADLIKIYKKYAGINKDKLLYICDALGEIGDPAALPALRSLTGWFTFNVPYEVEETAREAIREIERRRRRK
jgi:HEAT repeat protein